jgi:glycine cleavage system H protein
MDIPAELKYTASHEWVRIEPDHTLTVGITDYAQQTLGDIVYLELPPPGKKMAAGEVAAVIESVKAASDIYAPIPGEIIVINDALADAPDKINSDPYTYWLFKIKPSDETEYESLKSAEDYRQYIGA